MFLWIMMILGMKEFNLVQWKNLLLMLLSGHFVLRCYIKWFHFGASVHHSVGLDSVLPSYLLLLHKDLIYLALLRPQLDLVPRSGLHSKQRHWLTGLISPKDCEEKLRDWTSFTWEEAEKAEIVQRGEEKAHGDLTDI